MEITASGTAPGSEMFSTISSALEVSRIINGHDLENLCSSGGIGVMADSIGGKKLRQ